LPKALSELIKRKGFDSIHTKELPLKNLTPDAGIIIISKAEDRIVITKDSDFYNSFILKREPSKVVFVRVGNLKLSKLIDLFENNFESLISNLKVGSMGEVTYSGVRILY
jgi:predicted nuclease of predicted toxin-antitoxin system